MPHGCDKPWGMSVSEGFSTWQDAAEHAVSVVFAQKRRRKRADIAQIRTDLDEFIESLFHAPAGFNTAAARWAVIGANAAEFAEANQMEWVSEKVVHDLVCRKQHDYGPENIRRFGRQGLMVRMHDKVARLENLYGGGKEPMVNESLHDTVCDIIGYCVIGILWERQEFLLPFV